MDADIIVVGAGLSGSGRRARAGRRRPLGHVAGRRTPAVPRRAGVVVARWAVPGRLTPSSDGSGSGFGRARPRRLARQAGVRPPGGPLAASVGGGLRRLRRRREAVLAARAGRALVPAWCSGPNAAATQVGGHGNSVPRFHVTWGTGPGRASPSFAESPSSRRARVASAVRHRVTEDRASVRRRTGCTATVLEPSDGARGAPTSRRAGG